MADPKWDETTPIFEDTTELNVAPPGEAKPPKKVSFGEEAEREAMDAELAERGWFDKLYGGFGTALDNAALRLKQGAKGLDPADESQVRQNRQIATTGPGLAGNVAGNIAMMGPMSLGAGAARGAAAVAPTATRIAVNAAKAYPKVAAVAAPAAIGAGSVAALSPTTKDESELAQAGVGAVGGLAGKAIASTVVPAVVAGAKALFGGLVPRGIQDSQQATKALLEALDADGLDAAGVLKKAGDLAAKTGRPVTLADVVGSDIGAQNTRKLLQDSLAGAEGSTKREISKGLVSRAEGQQGRVVEDLAQGLGASKLPRSDVFDALEKTQAAKAKPLYDAAFKDKTLVVDDRLTQMMDRPSMVAAFKTMMSKAKERGEPLDVTYTLEPDTVPKALLTGVEKKGAYEMFAPSTKNLDTVKKKLYDIEQTFRRSGADSDAADVAATRRQLTSLLDEVAPDSYKQARKVWGDYAEMSEAFEDGTKLFKQDPAAIKKTIAAAGPAQRDAYVSGIVSGINEMTSKEGLDWAGNTLLRDTRKMAQIRAAFGDTPGAQKAFDAFKAKLETESNMLRSSKLYPAAGASTHGAGRTPGEIAGDVRDVAQGNVGSLLMRFLGKASGATRPGAQEKIAKTGFAPVKDLVDSRGRPVEDLTKRLLGGQPKSKKSAPPQLAPAGALSALDFDSQ